MTHHYVRTGSIAFVSKRRSHEPCLCFLQMQSAVFRTTLGVASQVFSSFVKREPQLFRLVLPCTVLMGNSGRGKLSEKSIQDALKAAAKSTQEVREAPERVLRQVQIELLMAKLQTSLTRDGALSLTQQWFKDVPVDKALTHKAFEDRVAEAVASVKLAQQTVSEEAGDEIMAEGQ